MSNAPRTAVPIAGRSPIATSATGPFTLQSPPLDALRPGIRRPPLRRIDPALDSLRLLHRQLNPLRHGHQWLDPPRVWHQPLDTLRTKHPSPNHCEPRVNPWAHRDCIVIRWISCEHSAHGRTHRVRSIDPLRSPPSAVSVAGPSANPEWTARPTARAALIAGRIANTASTAGRSANPTTTPGPTLAPIPCPTPTVAPIAGTTAHLAAAA
jgi:hypothetical protein